MPNKKDISIDTNESKVLLIIRHAKSSWELGTLSDFDRPLNDRGKKDAPMMAKRLLDKKIKIDAFISSPAKRAKKTAELFCEQYNQSIESIEFIASLYHAGIDDFYDTAVQLDDRFDTVAIFSHNPGITYFVNTLSEQFQIDDMPTCGIFAIRIQTKKWADFKSASKEFIFFDYPKNINNINF
ncbi:MAG: histidine phosphatase family protein [Chitinophagia bacterium]|jgi:phosphohistidine phosphatase|nr:histidine phosphatase family protein [Chitinophagia bacterium]